MNKTCARCEKTVYPTEELKCLDKVWHKGCFKCQECGMTLNMRTYKGYGKLPYCEAHVPKAKHTTMAETPELRRIAENTKLQSNVKYHADFEKSKGKFTQVADDPETLRIKANTKIISNVAYHGDLEKKAQMERQRQVYDNGEILDAPDTYHQQLDSYATEMLPTHPPTHQQEQPLPLPPKNHYQPPQPQIPQQNYNQNSNANRPVQYKEQHYKEPQYQSQSQQQYSEQYYRQQQQQQQKYDDYYQQQQQYQKYEDYPTPNQNHQNQNQYSYGYGGGPQYGGGAPVSGGRIGRIQDYDPLSDPPRAAPDTPRAAATLIYNSTDKRGSTQQSSAPRHIGRVTDLDPLADTHSGSHTSHTTHTTHATHTTHTTHVGHGNANVAHGNHGGMGIHGHGNAQANHHNQRVYVAMYDYEANDSDEVSFREGDLISNVTSIDEGWMTGQVLRTGRTGMLPANYVEISH